MEVTQETLNKIKAEADELALTFQELNNFCTFVKIAEAFIDCKGQKDEFETFAGEVCAKLGIKI